MFVYDALDHQRERGNDGVLGQALPEESAKLLLQLFMNRYPQLTSSWYAKTASTAPAFDPNADLWSYIASSTGSGQTVYEQYQSMPDKSLFLVDKASAQAAIQGQPVNVVYAIAKNQAIAQVVAGPTSSLAQLTPSGAAGGAPSKPTPKKELSPVVIPLIGAGIGLVVAGPVGAAVGAGIGIGVEIIREQQAKKAA